MDIRINQFRYFGCSKGITEHHHADVVVTRFHSITSPLERIRLPIHSRNNGTWVWTETNKPCPLIVEQLADDFRQSNPELWGCERSIPKEI